MARQLSQFNRMWESYPYPRGSARLAKRLIGGRVDADWLTNTCVIRLSRCFNYADHAVPNDFDGLNTVSGDDGMWYAYRVKEFSDYLNEVYGAPQFHHHYDNPYDGSIPDEFVGKQGIICFEVNGWSDATGHFDLWDGADCIHSAYFNRASDVYLWTVPDEQVVEQDASSAVLSGSVGENGSNRFQDVLLVQKLLETNAVNPGGLDGICGSKTIAAIRAFQSRFLSFPDGRVDVNGRTWRELRGM